VPNNTDKGNNGEQIALEFLIKNGYTILEKNWRFSHLEIDIICSNNNTLVIVEVKLRSTNYFGNPEQFIPISKQKKIIKAAEHYILKNNINYETRFDVVAIIQNNEELTINHITNAFSPNLL
jgi:putative endonuclease